MQKKKLPIIILMSVFTAVISVYSCSSSRKDHKQDKNTEMMKQDSVANQKYGGKNFKRMPPGQVAVKGHVIMFNENRPEEAVIKIDQILGYGSSTPMLAKGQQISASISNASVSDTTQGTDNRSLLTSGNIMIFILNHTGGGVVMGPAQKAPPAWRIQTILPQNPQGQQ